MNAQPWEAGMARLEGAYAQVADRLNSIDLRFAQIDTRFAQIDTRFAQIDGRFAQVDTRFAQVDTRFGQIENRMQQQFLWLVGSIFGTWVTTMLAILFHH
jgi:uncharacterized protein YukE